MLHGIREVVSAIKRAAERVEETSEVGFHLGKLAANADGILAQSDRLLMIAKCVADEPGVLIAVDRIGLLDAAAAIFAFGGIQLGLRALELAAKLGDCGLQLP